MPPFGLGTVYQNKACGCECIAHRESMGHMGPNMLRAALATEIDEREGVKKEGARDLDFGL